jgi:hypothetical protein
MLKLGQEVIIIGDSNANVGQQVAVSDVMPCDMGDGPTVFIYGVHPPQMRNGAKLYFQEKHLMPLDEVTVLDFVDESLFLPV